MNLAFLGSGDAFDSCGRFNGCFRTPPTTGLEIEL